MKRYAIIAVCIIALTTLGARAADVESVDTKQGFTTLYEVRDAHNALAAGGTLTNGLTVSTVTSDTIAEKTAGAGVTLDVLTKVKDGVVEHIGTAGTDPRAGWPILTRQGAYSVFEEDFYAAGYIAAAATIGTNGTTILQGGQFSEVADHSKWLVTVVDDGSDEAETISISDTGPFGVLAIQNNNAIADGENIQKNGMGVELVVGKELWFETKFSMEDADTNEVFIGLATADTTIIAGYPNEHIGFKVDGGDGRLDITVEMGNSNTTYDTGVTLTDSHAAFTNMTTAGFHYNGAGVIYTWVNGNNGGIAMSTTITASATVKIPTGTDMSPAMCILAEDTNTDNLYIDYIKIVQER